MVSASPPAVARTKLHHQKYSCEQFSLGYNDTQLVAALCQRLAAYGLAAASAPPIED